MQFSFLPWTKFFVSVFSEKKRKRKKKKVDEWESTGRGWGKKILFANKELMKFFYSFLYYLLHL